MRWATATAAGLVGVGLGGAGCAVEGPAVQIVADGGGAGYWPADSRTAAAGAIALAAEQALDGVELGVALTADGAALIARGPALEARRCRYADGRVLPHAVLVGQKTQAALVQGYVCGGEPEPAFDQALVVEEPPLPLGELVADLHDAPAGLDVWLRVHRAPPDRTARAVLERWTADDLPQALVVTSPDPEVLHAFDTEARTLGFDLQRWLVFPDPDDGVPDDFAAEVDGWAAGTDYVALAESAGADGILLRWDTVEPRLLRAARQAGVATGLWTVDDPRELARIVAAREVDVVLTNYPGDAP